MAPHRGHKFDSERTCEPPYISEPLAIQAERWRAWVEQQQQQADARAVAAAGDGAGDGASRTSGAAIVEPIAAEDLDAAFGAYSQTYDYAAARAEWQRQHPSRRRGLGERAWAALVYNAWLPLLMRLFMLLLSIATLVLGRNVVGDNLGGGGGGNAATGGGNGSNVNGDEDNNYDVPVCRASPIMIVLLAALAILILPYIAYDEYFGPPVGVRSPFSKARLLFLDLFFVVVYAVNVTLAGDEAFTPGCRAKPGMEMASFGLIVVTLVAWISAFSITLIRLIARISANYSSVRERHSSTRRLRSVNKA